MKRVFSIIVVWVILTAMSSQTGIPKAQAMFIYNFSRLIEWPTNYKSGFFVIGVLGSSPVLPELKTYTSGKIVGSQKIIVKEFKTLAEIGICHLLFVPYGKTKMLPQVIQSLGNKSTLIVSERNGAINNGASLNFVIVGNRLKFEIKPSNASSKNVNISSKLTDMAYKVY